jgi:DNA-binding response OmpR family regulator
MSARALVVDDSLTVRMDLRDALVVSGLDVSVAATIAEARDLLAAEDVAVVVLDVLLPDGDGISFLREIRANPRTHDIAVLLLSSEAEVRDRILGLETGADGYVGKPYDRAFVVARASELASRTAAVSSASTQLAVLVIDDSATYREELRVGLEAAGYHPYFAETGEDGLRMAAQRRPAAILVDGVLPGIDGATVIRHVRLDAALASVPCVLLTGSEGRGAELRALDAGADAFVRKEEDVTVVLARLAAVLRNATPSAPRDDLKSGLGPKTILAVDDSPTFLHEIATALRGEGYEVILARSGEEALDLLAIQPVDCILLDQMMPGLSGKDTCARIKGAPVVQEIPLIMLTSLEDREAMIDGLRAGADDYIAKSGEWDVLKARVRAQIRRRQFEDEHRRVREELLEKEVEATEARSARDIALARASLVEELERKNRELEAFSYSVSHDLRAPLRSIDGFSAALVDEYAERLDETAKHYLERVRSGAQRMGQLIDDMLELSRVSRAELKKSRIDVSSLARSVLAELAKGDPLRKVTAHVEDAMLVTADAGLLRILLENLLGNSWKFTARTESATIEVGAETHRGEHVYFIRDNGAGFNMEYAHTLFRPFQRLHGQAEFDGTGIGLATVHRIVDRHGGRVWAEGTVGRGATIRFTLPSAGSLHS